MVHAGVEDQGTGRTQGPGMASQLCTSTGTALCSLYLPGFWRQCLPLKKQGVLGGGTCLETVVIREPWMEMLGSQMSGLSSKLRCSMAAVTLSLSLCGQRLWQKDRRSPALGLQDPNLSNLGIIWAGPLPLLCPYSPVNASKVSSLSTVVMRH